RVLKSAGEMKSVQTAGKMAKIGIKGLDKINRLTMKIPGLGGFIHLNEKAFLMGLVGPRRYHAYQLALKANETAKAAKALSESKFFERPSSLDEAKAALQPKLKSLVNHTDTRRTL